MVLFWDNCLSPAMKQVVSPIVSPYFTAQSLCAPVYRLAGERREKGGGGTDCGATLLVPAL